MFDLTIQEFDGEPRALDLDIAEALGFERLRDVRKLIDRNTEALMEFGKVFRATWRETSEVGGRPGLGYWLNEKQALFITAKSDTPNAARIIIDMIEVFTAWKAGKLPPSTEQRQTHLPVDADTWLSAIREARLILGEAAAVQLWRQSPLPDLPVPLANTDKKDKQSNLSFINRFIVERCAVTGHTRDWVSSADLVIVIGDWLEGEGQMRWTSTTIARAFAKACAKYKPRKGQPNFTAHKCSRQGYLGIILNGSD